MTISPDEARNGILTIEGREPSPAQRPGSQQSLAPCGAPDPHHASATFGNILAVLKAQDEVSPEKAPALWTSAGDAARRLVVVAEQSSGQAAYVRGFLVRWWRADQIPVVALWHCDTDIRADMNIILDFLARVGVVYPDRFVTQTCFENWSHRSSSIACRSAALARFSEASSRRPTSSVGGGRSHVEYRHRYVPIALLDSQFCGAGAPQWQSAQS
jgi:hypothetical protein